MKLITWKYKDGSSLSQEWHPILDGDWPYPNNCEEVIFKMNTNNQIYED